MSKKPKLQVAKQQSKGIENHQETQRLEPRSMRASQQDVQTTIAGKYVYPANLNNNSGQKAIMPPAPSAPSFAAPVGGGGGPSDWLLDPVNLYMQGMAKRRGEMKKI